MLLSKITSLWIHSGMRLSGDNFYLYRYWYYSSYSIRKTKNITTILMQILGILPKATVKLGNTGFGIKTGHC